MICINILIYANLEKLKRKFGKNFIDYFVNKYHHILNKNLIFHPALWRQNHRDDVHYINLHKKAK